MMYWNGTGSMNGWGWALMTISMIVFWAVLITVGVALYRYLTHDPQQQNQPQETTTTQPAHSPEAILAERFARGEIDENEYHTRLGVLLRDAVRS